MVHIHRGPQKNVPHLFFE